MGTRVRKTRSPRYDILGLAEYELAVEKKYENGAARIISEDEAFEYYEDSLNWAFRDIYVTWPSVSPTALAVHEDGEEVFDIEGQLGWSENELYFLGLGSEEQKFYLRNDQYGEVVTVYVTPNKNLELEGDQVDDVN